VPRYIALTLTDPRPGQEAAYNEWYDHDHLDAIMATGAVTGARRFRAIDPARGGLTQQYVTVYEFDTDDIAEAQRKMGAASSDPASRQATEALIDPGSVVVRFYELLTDRST
jgi:hypothetical protein